MKHFKVISGIVSGSMLALGAGTLQAQTDVVETFNVQLTARASTNVTVNNIYKSKIVSMKVGNKDILSLLETATTNDFAGATLVYLLDSPAPFQVRRGTNVLANVSSFFTVDSSDDVYVETYNDNTGSDNYTGYWTQTLTFNDQRGHSFTLNGLVTEHYIASVANNVGVRKVSDTQTFNASGSGTADGDFALLSGTITSKGSGTDVW